MNHETEEPAWVCLECADKRGARIPKGHCYTSHTDICGICEQEKEVTEPRDFGVTRKLLRVLRNYWNIQPIFKFNNGNGAVLCNNCTKIIKSNITYNEAKDILFCDDRCRKDYYLIHFPTI